MFDLREEKWYLMFQSVVPRLLLRLNNFLYLLFVSIHSSANFLYLMFPTFTILRMSFCFQNPVYILDNIFSDLSLIFITGYSFFSLTEILNCDIVKLI